jgi:Fe-S-cluster-containing hydrogenase component 2
MINPQKSAIRIKYDFIQRKDIAAVCYQCKKAHCMDNCSTHALFRNNGVIEFNPTLCTGCQDCVEACPFDLIWSLPVEGKIVKCDLCSSYSTQYCVDTCPVDAISVITKKQITTKIS